MSLSDTWVVTLINEDGKARCWLADPDALAATTSFLEACCFLDFDGADSARRLAASIYQTPGERWVIDTYETDRRHGQQVRE